MAWNFQYLQRNCSTEMCLSFCRNSNLVFPAVLLVFIWKRGASSSPCLVTPHLSLYASHPIQKIVSVLLYQWVCLVWRRRVLKRQTGVALGRRQSFPGALCRAGGSLLPGCQTSRPLRGWMWPRSSSRLLPPGSLATQTDLEKPSAGWVSQRGEFQLYVSVGRAFQPTVGTWV